MGSRVFDGERSDGLKLAAVVELEILFLQGGDDFALRVANDNAHEDVVDANFEGCRSVLSGNLLNFTRWGFLCGLRGGIGICSGRIGGWRRVLRRRVLRQERAGQGCKGEEAPCQRGQKDMRRSR